MTKHESNLNHNINNTLLLAAVSLMSGGGQKIYPSEGDDRANYDSYMQRQEAHLKDLMVMVIRCYQETYLPLAQGLLASQNKQ